jgi:hypothetical protein
MPRLFVALHVGLIAVLTLFGLSFLLDPCGGGGDLCLGGAVGLATLVVAAYGGVGIVIWVAGHRASPLLVLDCLLVILGVTIVFDVGSDGPATTSLGGLLMAGLGLPAAVLAGRAVATHWIERLVAVAGLLGVAVLAGGGAGGLGVVALGLVALGAGWLSTQRRAAKGPRDRVLESRPHGEDREE